MYRIALIVLAVGFTAPAFAQLNVEADRTENVIYGFKRNPAMPAVDAGVSLTLDVWQPKANRNGRGIIVVISGGWVSSRALIPTFLPQEFLRRGYTLFSVVHASQPRYTIPDCIEDLHRAVRFIRTNAGEYGVDPDKLGIFGGSAGGHLSLMMGLSGKPGTSYSPDEVDRASSKVAAVACFFPPTDFLNYGKPGETALGDGTLKDFAAPFDFQEFDPTARRYERITDQARRREIGAEISPINHVSIDDAPILIVHGDADELVPIQQAELLMEKCKVVGLTHKLIVKPGAAHGWPNWTQDTKPMADWFDEHLK